MYGTTLSAAQREIDLVGWETLNDAAFLRGVAHAKGLVDRCVKENEAEDTLPDDDITRLVLDVVKEQLKAEFEARKRKAGVT